MPRVATATAVGDIGLKVQGRTYGEGHETDHFTKLRTMSVPKEMDALVNVLHTESKLLALPSNSAAEAIHAAYGTDLGLLTRYRDAFKVTLEATVRARADEIHIDAQAFLAEMVKQIGNIAHNPKLDLGPDVMRLEPAERLIRLQADFKADVEELKQAIVIWLHALTESDIVSAIEWLDAGKTAVKYHFFRMESARTDLGTKKHDPGMNLVGRHVTTKTTTKVDVFSERRTHTVVDAKSHSLDTYTRRVPPRIAHLIDSIPSEVRPFVTIIDGRVSKEEVSRMTEASRTETTERSVWVDDPTPALFGTWALAGWGGSTPETARSVYRGHALQRANNWLIGSAVATVVATAGAAFEGPRIAGAVFALCVILIVLSQIGMRVEASRQPQSASN